VSNQNVPWMIVAVRNPNRELSKFRI
jgi:hypothetical protein